MTTNTNLGEADVSAIRERARRFVQLMESPEELPLHEFISEVLISLAFLYTHTMRLPPPSIEKGFPASHIFSSSNRSVWVRNLRRAFFGSGTARPPRPILRRFYRLCENLWPLHANFKHGLGLLGNGGRKQVYALTKLRAGLNTEWGHHFLAATRLLNEFSRPESTPTEG